MQPAESRDNLAAEHAASGQAHSATGDPGRVVWRVSTEGARVEHLLQRGSGEHW